MDLRFKRPSNPYDSVADSRSPSYLGYFLNRNVWVTPWDATWLNLREYGHRFWRSFVYALMLAGACTVIALLFAIAFLTLSGERGMTASLRASISSVAGVAYPVDIDYQGVHANMGTDGEVLPDDAEQIEEEPQMDSKARRVERMSGTSGHFDRVIFILCIAEVGIISLLGMAFSGAYAEVFLTPINCLKTAPLVLVRRRLDGTWALSLRIWICLPQEVFLHDFNVAVAYTYDGRYSESIMNITGNGMKETIGTKTYAMVRGTWHVDVPLVSVEGRKLLGLLRSEKPNPRVQFLLQGLTSSGEVVSKRVMYDRAHIVCGYKPAPYERDAYCDYSGCSPTSEQANPSARFYSYGAFAMIELDESAGEKAKLDKDAAAWFAWLDDGELDEKSLAIRNEAIKAHVRDGQAKWEPHLTRKELREIWNL